MGGTFARLPSLGIDAQPLTNSTMRSLVFRTKKPGHHQGILVIRVERFSCAEAAGVKAGDILMAIDDEPIGEEGDVMFRRHERVDYQYVITRKKIGDIVKLKLLRASGGSAVSSGRTFDPTSLMVDKAAAPPGTLETLHLQATLAPTHDLLPRELKKDYAPEYALIGGLVFIIAGLPLEDLCKRKAQASSSAVALYQTVHDLLEPKRDGNEKPEDLPEKDSQAVLCSDWLAHDINEGYQPFVGLRLHKVNGVKVKNMAHLVELVAPLIDKSVETPPAAHAILSFFNIDCFAVFETTKLRAATPVIQRQHKIPNWTSIATDAGQPQGQKRQRE